MADKERWERLAAKLTEAGFEGIQIDERTWHNQRQRKTGISYSIGLQVKGKGYVEISDSHNRYTEKWVGWRVYVEDTEGILQGTPSRCSTKKSETVAAFQAAIARIGG